MRLILVGLVVVVVTGCIPERVTGALEGYPMCPSSPEAWDAADYVPLGCEKP